MNSWNAFSAFFNYAMVVMLLTLKKLTKTGFQEGRGASSPPVRVPAIPEATILTMGWARGDPSGPAPSIRTGGMGTQERNVQFKTQKNKEVWKLSGGLKGIVQCKRILAILAFDHRGDHFHLYGLPQAAQRIVLSFCEPSRMILIHNNHLVVTFVLWLWSTRETTMYQGKIMCDTSYNV